MKLVDVPAVYIATDRIRSPQEFERLERMLGRIDYAEKIEASSSTIQRIIAEKEWYVKLQRTGQKREGNPNIIFSTFDWSDPRNNPLKAHAYEPHVPGGFSFADFRDKRQLRLDKGVVCNSGYEIHTAFGCFHACSYCHIGNAFTIMLDIEQFVEKLGILMDNNPWQKLYKYDNQSDIPTLEPEYGAIESLVNFFSTTDKSLMLYTKSDNVDYLMDLDHKGKTIVCWTISNDEVAQGYEWGVPGLDERLAAARKCQEAGYRIRFRFSPIIPIKGWKEKNKEMIRKVFEMTQPEVISLESLCHLTRQQFDDICTGLEFLPQERITEYELFSHAHRLEMYTFFLTEIRNLSKDVKLSLCLETEQMWKDLKCLLQGTPSRFFCCCGAKCC